MLTTLNIKTEFNLLEYNVGINRFIQYALDNKWTHLAIADKDNLYGGADLYYACQKSNLIPIFGVELTVKHEGYGEYPLFLYAKNEKGYRELCATLSQKLINKGILFNEIIKSNNLVVIEPMEKGILLDLYKNKNITEFLNKADEFISKFEYAFIGKTQLERKQNEFEKEVSKVGFKVVFHPELNSLSSDDLQAHNALISIKNNQVVDESKFLNLNSNTEFDFTTNNIKHASSAYVEELNNLISLFKNYSIKTKNPILKFNNYNNVDSNTFLEALASKGIKEKLKTSNIPVSYYNRLQKELAVIKETGFADYFLIVWDIVRFSKQNNIVVGPGRGSAPGSLISFCLEITEIDPIKHQLIFERFLNPKRSNMPDIDIDIQDDRRQEVINYVFNRYGYDHVAHIVTYQRIGTKMALRDIGRVLDFPIHRIDWMTKQISVDANNSVKKALAQNHLLSMEFEKDRRVRLLFKLADLIIGRPRQIGTHAAGIILTDSRIQTLLPVQILNNLSLTQFDMTHLEQIGLLKIDVLGIRNLTIIHKTIRLIKANRSIDGDIIYEDDIKTFDVFCQGLTNGIFQFESPGMKKLLRNVKPRNVNDLTLVNSLYRPGPQKNIETFLRRREGKEVIKYPSLIVADILKPTLGIIIYQEQILEILQKFAGFDLSDADVFRRAISKKQIGKMEQYESKFFESCDALKRNKTEAKDIFDSILRFANYGFNKSHALAYSIIGYRMAFLKTHYPTEFFCNLLNNHLGNHSKTFEYFKEAKQFNIVFQPPDLNNSECETIVSENKIIFGFLTIKNLGQMMGKRIIAERNQNGKFTDYFSTIARLRKIDISETVIEALIYAGALDFISRNRSELIQNLTTAFSYSANTITTYNNEKTFHPELIESPVFDSYEEESIHNSRKELDVLGLNLSNHPIAIVKKRMPANVDKISDINEHSKSLWNIIGIVTKIKKIKTKKGDEMAFVSLEDESGSVDVVVFPNAFYENVDKLEQHKILQIQASKDNSKYKSVVLKTIIKSITI